MKPSRYFLLLAFAASSGLAQDNTNGETLLGAALRTRPEYDGSDRRKTGLAPVVRYYGSPWFLRTTHGVLEGGARLGLGGGATAGVQIAHEAGPRDRDPGASLGAHLEWTTKAGPAPLNALARFRNQLDSDRGSELDARLTIGVYGSERMRAGVFAQATWSSDRHMRAYYAVDGSGLLFTSVGALGSYDISRRWVLLGTGEWRRLGGKPAQSAFVEKRAGVYGTVGAGYRF